MTKIFVSFIITLLWLAGADAQTPFYQGKTISIIVGYQAGDGYDIWSRLLAAHMGKHIPGNPGMIAQNMPGAGSMIAANHIFNVAKPDGLSLGRSVHRFISISWSAKRKSISTGPNSAGSVPPRIRPGFFT